MTDPKGRSKAACNLERKKRDQARKKKIKQVGKAAVKGKDVHHKDGVRTNNGKGNTAVIGKSAHGKKHGRGHKKPTR